MAKKEKEKDKDRRKREDEEAPVDLASRIGARGEPPAPPPPPAAPIEPPRPFRLDAPLPPRRPDTRPTVVGGNEPPPPPISIDPQLPADERTASIPSPRLPPGAGESDLVVTPLPTADDWHRFELALRRVRGVGQLRTEYYRHGVLKVRVSYSGAERLAEILRSGVPGYRVRVIGEDRATLQILVASETEERRPG
ncbi:MAG TPA: hypothetical protein VGQ86_09650 [Candidatus Limnocylindria bacterium]|nr:hypothetical protein [Candidatus Limnocylindria bacterium]